MMEVIAAIGYSFLVILLIAFIFASGYACPNQRAAFIPGFVIGFVLNGFYLTSFLLALILSLISFLGYSIKRDKGKP
jgi:fructose-specific phosphotransferase system IIC component|tara:strand:+ start:315 stop:545 length:231 start_codon:yes stop_codon:yes gene_type:complete